MGTKTIDPDRLRAVLLYEPESGNFYWRVQAARRTKVGELAGTIDRDGYIRIQIDGRIFKAHRLAFIYMTDSCEAQEVDHINGIRSDNRWGNLRLADKTANMQNKRRPQSNNTTGFLGVTFDKRRGKYVANIAVNGKRKTIGRFVCPLEASNAYKVAKAQFHNVSLN